MDWIKKVFGYYILGFKNSFNYKEASTRTELNYFILVFSVAYLLLFFITFFTSLILAIYKPIIAAISFAVMIGIILLYSLAHVLPALSLIYRRIKDIFSTKARMVFGIYVVVWAIQFICCLTNCIITLSISKISEPTISIFVTLFALGIIAQILGLGMLGFVIFLMCKKGNM